MLSPNIKRAVDIVANVAVLVICAALLLPFLGRHLRPVFRNDGAATSLLVGAIFPQLPTLSYSAHHATVLLFLNTHCVSCRESRSDYFDLQTSVKVGNNSAAVYAVFSAADSQQAIGEMQLRLPTIRVERFDKYHVSGTPTIVLINHKGIVKDFWIGTLTANAQTNLVRLAKEI